MIKKSYFKTDPGDPKPLSCVSEFTVRFNELDPMNIVWHGNYAVYFEEGRLAFGRKFNIGYMDFYDNGVTIPLKQIHFDYFKPLEFAKTYKIEVLLYWNEAARLDFEFRIYGQSNELMASGYSIQLMVDKNKGVLVSKPDFYEEICNKWRDGKIF